MRLRPATAADAPFVRALYADVLATTFPPAAFEEPLRTALLDGQFAARRANHAGGEDLVVEDDGDPVGHVVLRRSADEVHVVDLAIAPARRGRGLGTAVLEHLAGEGRDVVLEVERTNGRAAALYRRLGFVDDGSDAVTARLRRRR